MVCGVAATPSSPEMRRIFSCDEASQPPVRIERVKRFRAAGFPQKASCFVAFSLLEVLVVVSLLSLIVIALMSVFSGTQRAFRASITQTDILEGGRATVDLIASDLRTMTPSGGTSNVVGSVINCPVNFAVFPFSPVYPTMPQVMTASSNERFNVLNCFFVLGRENTKWTAVGYAVNAASTSPLYPLYRFYAETNITASPESLFNRFVYYLGNGQWTNMSHVVDGVVHLNLRAYDPNGIWIQNLQLPYYTGAQDVLLSTPYYTGSAQVYMFGKTVPAAVDFEIGLLEDSTLARAESRGTPGYAPWAPQNAAQWNYLTNQIGALHLFHQRVNIPNVDLSAYK